MPGKKVAECRSGLRPSDKELPSRHSGVFHQCSSTRHHKNTPGLCNVYTLAPNWFTHSTINCTRTRFKIQCHLICWKITNNYINFCMEHLFIRWKILTCLYMWGCVLRTIGNEPVLGSVLFNLLVCTLLYELVWKKQWAIKPAYTFGVKNFVNIQFYLLRFYLFMYKVKHQVRYCRTIRNDKQ
jgi:hypothetical protein